MCCLMWHANDVRTSHNFLHAVQAEHDIATAIDITSIQILVTNTPPSTAAAH